MTEKIICDCEIYCKDCNESLTFCSKDMYFSDIYFQCFRCAEKENEEHREKTER